MNIVACVCEVSISYDFWFCVGISVKYADTFKEFSCGVIAHMHTRTHITYNTYVYSQRFFIFVFLWNSYVLRYYKRKYFSKVSVSVWDFLRLNWYFYAVAYSIVIFFFFIFNVCLWHTKKKKIENCMLYHSTLIYIIFEIWIIMNSSKYPW